jgi:hypothetical protein
MPPMKWLQIAGLVTSLLLSTGAVGFAQSAKEYPHIEAAQEALKKAASELEAGAHNFGGHRAKALQLVKQAQKELREAIAWAKAHPAAGKDKK